MGDLLGIGASGVRAYQTALSVVGGNIANAASTGYVRRDVRLTENPSASAVSVTGLGSGANGGVLASGVTRAWDAFKAAQVRNAASDVSASETSVTYLARMEAALSSSGAGTSLTTFFNSATALAADPTGTAARTQFLSDADGVARAFNGTAAALVSVADDLAVDTTASVDTLNGLTASLAEVNRALATAKSGTNAAAAVADQRDSLIDKISALAAVSVTTDARGVATVRLNGANGPVLVDGASSGRLAAETNASGATVFTLYRDGAGEGVAVTGGALAGLADAAARVNAARAGLDDVANGFAAAVNATQAAGVDLAGTAGKAMFSTRYGTATPLPGASGSADISVAVAADATPAAGGYTALWDAATAKWTVSRTDGGASVTGTGALSIDGVTITLGGAPQPGDGFAITTGSGAAGLATTGLASSQVAAAARWTVNAPIGNTGTGTVRVETSDAAGLPVGASYAIGYADGTITVTDPATQAVLATRPYTAGMTIAGAGFTLTLSGQMKDGDSFTLNATGANSRGNGNLAALDRLRTSGGFEGRIDGLVQANASALAAKRSLADAQGAILDNATAARDEVSGVNLDTEAVALMRFQQAYQASSRVIQVARETFQNILDVV